MTTEFKAADTSIEDWIDGVSYLQADVTIYRDPALLAEYNPLIERIEALHDELEDIAAAEHAPEDAETPLSGPDAAVSAPVPDGERSMRDKPVVAPHVAEIRAELDELYAKAEALHARFTANREIWNVRKLEEDEAEAIRDELAADEDWGPMPEAPAPLAKNASKTMRAKHVEKFEAFVQDMTVWTEEFNLRSLARCVQKVDVNGVDKPAPSLADLRRVKARPGGVGHIRELVSALENLATEGVAIVAPHRDRA